MLTPPKPPPPATIDSAARLTGMTGQRLRAQLHAAYSAARVGDVPIWPVGLAGTHADVVTVIRFVNELAIYAAGVRNAGLPQRAGPPETRRAMRLGTGHRRAGPQKM